MFFYSSRAHESTSSLPSPTVYIMNDEKEDFEVFKIPKTDKNNETHEKRWPLRQNFASKILNKEPLYCR